MRGSIQSKKCWGKGDFVFWLRFKRFKKIFRGTTYLIVVQFVASHAVWAQPQTGFQLTPPVLLQKDILSLTVPESYGNIKQTYLGDKGKVVIHVQDSHVNYQAQTNIAEILKHLVRELTEQGNGARPIIAIEGAASASDPEWFRLFPNEAVKKKVLDYYLKRGYISGAQFFQVFSEEPISVVGVEDPKLYLENLNYFRETYTHNKKILAHIDGLRTALLAIRQRSFNKDLLLLSQKSDAFHQNELPLTDTISFLVEMGTQHQVNLQPWPQLLSAHQAIELEKKIDYDQVNKERDKLITRLKEKLPQEEVSELVTQALYFRLGKTSSLDFYTYLEEAACSAQIQTDLFPQLLQYIEALSAHQQIDGEQLYKQLVDVEQALKQALFKTDVEKTCSELLRRLQILEHLAKLELSRDELKEYRQNPYAFMAEEFLFFIEEQLEALKLNVRVPPNADEINDYFVTLEGFYRTALARDQALMQNTLKALEKEKAQVAILVTGGFHTEGMVPLFEKENISTMVIAPRITEDFGNAPYLDAMLNERLPLTRVLNNKGNRISQPILTFTQTPINGNLKEQFELHSELIMLYFTAAALATGKINVADINAFKNQVEQDVLKNISSEKRAAAQELFKAISNARATSEDKRNDALIVEFDYQGETYVVSVANREEENKLVQQLSQLFRVSEEKGILGKELTFAISNKEQANEILGKREELAVTQVELRPRKEEQIAQAPRLSVHIRRVQAREAKQQQPPTREALTEAEKFIVELVRQDQELSKKLNFEQVSKLVQKIEANETLTSTEEDLLEQFLISVDENKETLFELLIKGSNYPFATELNILDKSFAEIADKLEEIVALHFPKEKDFFELTEFFSKVTNLKELNSKKTKDEASQTMATGFKTASKEVAADIAESFKIIQESSAMSRFGLEKKSSLGAFQKFLVGLKLNSSLRSPDEKLPEEIKQKKIFDKPGFVVYELPSLEKDKINIQAALAKGEKASEIKLTAEARQLLIQIEGKPDPAVIHEFLSNQFRELTVFSRFQEPIQKMRSANDKNPVVTTTSLLDIKKYAFKKFKEIDLMAEIEANAAYAEMADVLGSFQLTETSTFISPTQMKTALTTTLEFAKKATTKEEKRAIFLQLNTLIRSARRAAFGLSHPKFKAAMGEALFIYYVKYVFNELGEKGLYLGDGDGHKVGDYNIEQTILELKKFKETLSKLPLEQQEAYFNKHFGDQFFYKTGDERDKQLGAFVKSYTHPETIASLIEKLDDNQFDILKQRVEIISGHLDLPPPFKKILSKKEFSEAVKSFYKDLSEKEEYKGFARGGDELGLLVNNPAAVSLLGLLVDFLNERKEGEKKIPFAGGVGFAEIQRGDTFDAVSKKNAAALKLTKLLKDLPPESAPVEKYAYVYGNALTSYVADLVIQGVMNQVRGAKSVTALEKLQDLAKEEDDAMWEAAFANAPEAWNQWQEIQQQVRLIATTPFDEVTDQNKDYVMAQIYAKPDLRQYYFDLMEKHGGVEEVYTLLAKFDSTLRKKEEPSAPLIEETKEMIPSEAAKAVLFPVYRFSEKVIAPVVNAFRATPLSKNKIEDFVVPLVEELPLLAILAFAGPVPYLIARAFFIIGHTYFFNYLLYTVGLTTAEEIGLKKERGAIRNTVIPLTISLLASLPLLLDSISLAVTGSALVGIFSHVGLNFMLTQTGWGLGKANWEPFLSEIYKIIDTNATLYNENKIEAATDSVLLFLKAVKTWRSKGLDWASTEKILNDLKLKIPLESLKSDEPKQIFDSLYQQVVTPAQKLSSPRYIPGKESRRLVGNYKLVQNESGDLFAPLPNTDFKPMPEEEYETDEKWLFTQWKGTGGNEIPNSPKQFWKPHVTSSLRPEIDQKIVLIVTELLRTRNVGHKIHKPSKMEEHIQFELQEGATSLSDEEKELPVEEQGGLRQSLKLITFYPANNEIARELGIEIELQIKNLLASAKKAKGEPIKGKPIQGDQRIVDDGGFVHFRYASDDGKGFIDPETKKIIEEDRSAVYTPPWDPNFITEVKELYEKRKNEMLAETKKIEKPVVSKTTHNFSLPKRKKLTPYKPKDLETPKTQRIQAGNIWFDFSFNEKEESLLSIFNQNELIKQNFLNKNQPFNITDPSISPALLSFKLTDKNKIEFTTYDSENETFLMEPNEDASLHLAFENKVRVCAVFDGLGGEAAGEVASSTAKKVFEKELSAAFETSKRTLNREGVETKLKEIFSQARTELNKKENADETLQGMNTTAVVAVSFINENGERQMVVGNAGDSRAYVFGDETQRLEQLTDDDSLLRTFANEWKENNWFGDDPEFAKTISVSLPRVSNEIEAAKIFTKIYEKLGDTETLQKISEELIENFYLYFNRSKKSLSNLFLLNRELLYLIRNKEEQENALTLFNSFAQSFAQNILPDKAPDDPNLRKELHSNLRLLSNNINQYLAKNEPDQFSKALGLYYYHLNHVVSNNLRSTEKLLSEDKAVSFFSTVLNPNDRLILTSDGVHDNLMLNELELVLMRTPQALSAQNLVLTAQKNNRKPDDITAAVETYADWEITAPTTEQDKKIILAQIQYSPTIRQTYYDHLKGRDDDLGTEVLLKIYALAKEKNEQEFIQKMEQDRDKMKKPASLHAAIEQYNFSKGVLFPVYQAASLIVTLPFYLLFSDQILSREEFKNYLRETQSQYKNWIENFLVPGIEETALYFILALFGPAGYVLARALFVAAHATRPIASFREALSLLLIPTVISIAGVIALLPLAASIQTVFIVGLIAHIASNLFATYTQTALQKGVLGKRSPYFEIITLSKKTYFERSNATKFKPKALQLTPRKKVILDPQTQMIQVGSNGDSILKFQTNEKGEFELVVFSEKTKSQPVKLKKGAKYTVGEGKENSFRLPFKEVAKTHLSFRVTEDNRIAVTDLNSGNGTLIREIASPQVDLKKKAKQRAAVAEESRKQLVNELKKQEFSKKIVFIRENLSTPNKEMADYENKTVRQITEELLIEASAFLTKAKEQQKKTPHSELQEKINRLTQITTALKQTLSLWQQQAEKEEKARKEMEEAAPPPVYLPIIRPAPLTPALPSVRADDEAKLIASAQNLNHFITRVEQLRQALRRLLNHYNQSDLTKEENKVAYAKAYFDSVQFMEKALIKLTVFRQQFLERLSQVGKYDREKDVWVLNRPLSAEAGETLNSVFRNLLQALPKAEKFVRHPFKAAYTKQIQRQLNTPYTRYLLIYGSLVAQDVEQFREILDLNLPETNRQIAVYLNKWETQHPILKTLSERIDEEITFEGGSAPAFITELKKIQTELAYIEEQIALASINAQAQKKTLEQTQYAIATLEQIPQAKDTATALRLLQDAQQIYSKAEKRFLNQPKQNQFAVQWILAKTAFLNRLSEIKAPLSEPEKEEKVVRAKPKKEELAKKTEPTEVKKFSQEEVLSKKLAQEFENKRFHIRMKAALKTSNEFRRRARTRQVLDELKQFIQKFEAEYKKTGLLSIQALHSNAIALKKELIKLEDDAIPTLTDIELDNKFFSEFNDIKIRAEAALKGKNKIYPEVINGLIKELDQYFEKHEAAKKNPRFVSRLEQTSAPSILRRKLKASLNKREHFETEITTATKNLKQKTTLSVRATLTRSELLQQLEQSIKIGKLIQSYAQLYGEDYPKTVSFYTAELELKQEELIALLYQRKELELYTVPKELLTLITKAMPTVPGPLASGYANLFFKEAAENKRLNQENAAAYRALYGTILKTQPAILTLQLRQLEEIKKDHALNDPQKDLFNMATNFTFSNMDNPFEFSAAQSQIQHSSDARKLYFNAFFKLQQTANEKKIVETTIDHALDWLNRNRGDENDRFIRTAFFDATAAKAKTLAKPAPKKEALVPVLPSGEAPVEKTTMTKKRAETPAPIKPTVQAKTFQTRDQELNEYRTLLTALIQEKEGKKLYAAFASARLNTPSEGDLKNQNPKEYYTNTVRKGPYSDLVNLILAVPTDMLGAPSSQNKLYAKHQYLKQKREALRVFGEARYSLDYNDKGIFSKGPAKTASISNMVLVIDADHLPITKEGYLDYSKLPPDLDQLFSGRNTKTYLKILLFSVNEKGESQVNAVKEALMKEKVLSKNIESVSRENRLSPKEVNAFVNEILTTAEAKFKATQESVIFITTEKNHKNFFSQALQEFLLYLVAEPGEATYYVEEDLKESYRTFVGEDLPKKLKFVPQMRIDRDAIDKFKHEEATQRAA